MCERSSVSSLDERYAHSSLFGRLASLCPNTATGCTRLQNAFETCAEAGVFCEREKEPSGPITGHYVHRNDPEFLSNVCLPVSGTCDEHSATFGSLSPGGVFTVRGGPTTDRDVNSSYGGDPLGFTPPQTTPVMEQQFTARSHQASPSTGCNFSPLHMCVEAVETVRVSEGRSAPGCCSLSSGVGHDRCFPHRMGGNVESEGYLWALDTDPGHRAYQPARTKGSVLGPKVLHAGSGRPPCSRSVRQYLNSVPSEPPGRHKIPQVSTVDSRDPDMVSATTCFTEGSSYTRSVQPDSGCSFPGSSTSGRMEASSRCSAGDLATIWESRSGSFCFREDNPLPIMVHKDRGVQSTGPGCAVSRMAGLPAICVSTYPSVMGDVAQDLAVQAQSVTCGTTVASQTMVSFVAETSDRKSMEASSQEGPPLPAGGQCLAPGPGSSAALGMAIGLKPSLEHCDPAVIHTISNARASSTRQIYASRWKLFSAWCEEQGFDPATCDIPSVLSFLQRLLEEGKAASTLKVYVAAISAYHVPVGGSSLGSHSLVCSFLKGARRLNPARNPHFPVWDLSLVLAFLCSPQFEPLQSIDIKWMSLKTSFLLAIATAKRVSELHALSVSERCLRWLPDDSGVVLRPNPSFLPKVLLPQFINQHIELASFQTSSESDSSAQLLCPVRALRCYVNSTVQFRQSDQLFVCYGGVKKGAPVSKQRLSNWIVETIMLAYKAAGKPLPWGITCHSTRAISSSWAVFRGVSLVDICTAATWASPCTFARFYKVNVAAHHAVSSAVLLEQP